MSTHGHKEKNNRHWGLQNGGTWGGANIEILPIEYMFTIWVMGTLETQSPPLHNIPMKQAHSCTLWI